MASSCILTDSTYLKMVIWNFECVLKSQDLWNVIPRWLSCYVKNFKAKMILSKSLDDINHQRIIGCQTPNQMFKKLRLFHEGNSTTSIAKLKQKFYEISWTDDVKGKRLVKYVSLTKNAWMFFFETNLIRFDDVHDIWILASKNNDPKYTTSSSFCFVLFLVWKLKSIMMAKKKNVNTQTHWTIFNWIKIIFSIANIFISSRTATLMFSFISWWLNLNSIFLRSINRYTHTHHTFVCLFVFRRASYSFIHSIYSNNKSSLCIMPSNGMIIIIINDDGQTWWRFGFKQF